MEHCGALWDYNFCNQAGHRLEFPDCWLSWVSPLETQIEKDHTTRRIWLTICKCQGTWLRLRCPSIWINAKCGGDLFGIRHWVKDSQAVISNLLVIRYRARLIRTRTSRGKRLSGSAASNLWGQFKRQQCLQIDHQGEQSYHRPKWSDMIEVACYTTPHQQRHGVCHKHFAC
jgi:hypothetical protein